MPLIIAATDFSDVAQNAVNYACKLAAAHNAQVLVLHSYILPVMFSDVPMPANIVDDALNEAQLQMKQMVADLSQSYPNIKIKGRVIYGDTIDILDDYESHTKPLLIVVGNSNSGDKNTWLDNTLIEEFKKLKYPVIAIPPHLEYKPVQKICFAFDNKNTGNNIALQQLSFLTTSLNTELHVFNAQAGANNNDNSMDINPEAKQLLSQANPHYHIIYDVHDTDQAIQDFVKQNNMDWLVMIPRKHSFFEGLFYKSHTKAIAHSSPVPIVALHEHS